MQMENDTNWKIEVNRWQQYYHSLLQQRLDDIEADIRSKRISPENYENISEILAEGVKDTDNWAQYLTLIDQMYPYPVWWGKWKLWGQQITLGLDIAISAEDLDFQVKYYYYLADINIMMGHLDTGKELIQKGIRAVQRGNNQLLYSRLLLLDFMANEEAGIIPDSYKKISALEETIGSERDAQISLEKKLIDLDLSLHKADILRRQGKIHQSVSLLHNLKDSLQLQGDWNTYANAQIQRYLGLAYWSADEYDKAIQNLNQAAEHFGEVGNWLFQINTKGSLGLVLWGMGKLKEAESVFKENIQRSQALKANRWLLIQLGNLGLVYLSKGQLDLANDYIGRHLSLSSENGNHLEAHRARGNLGIVQLHMGDFEGAIQNLEFDVRNLEKTDANIGLACAYASLAWAHEGKGERQKALELAARVKEISGEIDSEATDLLYLRCIGEIEQQADVLQQALKKAVNLNRTIDVAAIMLTLSDLENRKDYFDKASMILSEVGAEAWLENPVVFRNLRLPLFN